MSMINKTKINYYTMFITLLCLSSISIYGQSEEDRSSPAAAPIDDYIYLMIFIAILTVAYFFQNKTKQS
jgi:hypothetical protein